MNNRRDFIKKAAILGTAATVSPMTLANISFEKEKKNSAKPEKLKHKVMRVRFLGQNCFLFSYKGKNIMSDPFYNIQKEKSGFDIAAQKIDFILLTHAHGDHTADVKEVIKFHPDVRIIAQPEICRYFGHADSIDINIGGSTIIENMKISMVSASHTSSFPDGAYGGHPAGYILKVDKKNVYLSGDTGVIPEMGLLSALFGKIDCAILPVGGHYTMDAEQAAFASSELIKTSKVVACHFDTFPPITINHEQAKKVFKQRNIELTLPKLGEEFDV